MERNRINVDPLHIGACLRNVMMGRGLPRSIFLGATSDHSTRYASVPLAGVPSTAPKEAKAPEVPVSVIPTLKTALTASRRKMGQRRATQGHEHVPAVDHDTN